MSACNTSGQPTSRKRKDVDLEEDIPVKRFRPEDTTLTVVCVADDAGTTSTERSEVVPFIDDIPEIFADEDDKDDNDDGESADPTDDGDVSDDTEGNGDDDADGSTDEETEYEQAYSSTESSNADRASTPLPNTVDNASDDLPLCGKRTTFLDLSDNDDALSEYQFRTALQRVLLRVQLRQRFWDDEEGLKEFENSLLSCRLSEIMEERANLGLWQDRCITKIIHCSLDSRDEICKREHKWAHPFVAHLPVKQRTCSHLRPIRSPAPPSSPICFPMKIPLPRLRWRARRLALKPSKLSQCISAESLAEALEDGPNEPSIEISDAYAEDGRLIKKGTASGQTCTGCFSAAIDALNPTEAKSAASRGDAVSQFVVLKEQMEKAQDAEVGGEVNDYPEILSEYDDYNAFWDSCVSPERPLHDVDDDYWPVRWEDTEPTGLWALLPMTS